jgi:hypothetical protein
VSPYDTPVNILRSSADGEPETIEAMALIGNTLIFPITTDVEGDDLVEYKLVSGKTRSVRLSKVTHHRRRAVWAPGDSTTSRPSSRPSALMLGCGLSRAR